MTTSSPDRMILQRRITGERTPRFYSMTGSTFAAMLEAVKALPFRRFEETSQVKSWLVHGDGIAALKQQGYTIEPQALFRVRSLVNTSVYDHDDRIFATDYFEERDQFGGWRSMPMYANIEVVGMTEEACQAVSSAIDARRAELGLQLAPARRYEAVQEIARRAITLYGQRIIQAFSDALHGQWTDEAYDAALAVVEDLLDQDQATQWTRLVVGPDGTLVDQSHVDYPALIAAYETVVAMRTAAQQQAAEQRQAERKANAPQIVRDWFERCTKQEIIEIVAARTGRTISSTLKKAQIIDELTSDRAFCELLV